MRRLSPLIPATAAVAGFADGLALQHSPTVSTVYRAGIAAGGGTLAAIGQGPTDISIPLLVGGLYGLTSRTVAGLMGNAGEQH